MDQLPSIIDRLGQAKFEDIDDVEAEARRLSNDPVYLQILTLLGRQIFYSGH